MGRTQPDPCRLSATGRDRRAAALADEFSAGCPRPPHKYHILAPSLAMGMEKGDKPIKSLVDSFLSGEIMLPDIQRKYVWKKAKARDLIDSIYKGYPSGSILLRKVSAPARTRSAAVEQTGASKGRLLLLDGQQRLTSLAAVLRGKPVRTSVRGRIKNEKIEIYFNVGHDEDAGAARDNGARGRRILEVKNPSVANDPLWIPVTELVEKGVSHALASTKTSQADPNFGKYNDRLNELYRRLESYSYASLELDSETPEQEVAEIFVRLNSGGAKLRKADLTLARVTPHWPGMMDTLGNLSALCSKKSYNIHEGFLVRCLVAATTGQSRLEGVGAADVGGLKENWESTKRGIRFAIDFCRSDALIETSEVLPSLYPLIPVMLLAIKNNFNFSPALANKTRKWLYLALIWSRYSGSVETALDEDLAAIRDSDDPVELMIEKIRHQSGRLEVGAEDFEGKNTRSPLLNMMYILARHAGARDWGTGIEFRADPGKGLSSAHGKIFGGDAVKAALAKRHGAAKTKRLLSDIANTAFVANHRRVVGQKAPDAYLPGIHKRMGDGALEAQCVPASPSLWKVDNYEDFLRRRRGLLADRINALLSSLDPGQAEPRDDLATIRGGESESVELKATMLWDIKKKRANRGLVDAVVREVVAFMNKDGGTVYVGVSDKDGAILGLDDDYRALNRHDWTGWSERLADAVKLLGPVAAGNVTCKPVEIEGKTVARITVKKGDEPAYMGPPDRRVFVVREGPISVTLNTPDALTYISKRFPGWSGGGRGAG